jgi:GMP synthase-like glutamine amidotransferase
VTVRILVLAHPDSRDPGLAGERARAAGAEVDCWCPADGTPPPADPASYDGIIVLGGGANVEDAPTTPWLREEIDHLRGALRAGTPMLGLCLGAQLLAEAGGGSVRRTSQPEVGWYDVATTPEASGDAVFAALPPSFTAYEWHSFIVDPPPGSVVLARNEGCVQAFRFGTAWGTQFHPEVTPEILGKWIPDYPTDPDAARVGGDPAEALAEVPARLPAWNAVGRELFDRWLAAAAQSAPASSRSEDERAA